MRRRFSSPQPQNDVFRPDDFSYHFPSLLGEIDTEEETTDDDGNKIKIKDGKITRKELVTFYENRNAHPVLMDKLRSVIFPHPLEFDSSLYGQDIAVKLRKFGMAYDDSAVSALQAKSAKLDYWAHIQGASFFQGVENMFYFAHPIKFFQHLDQIGALEFNPYMKGKPITTPPRNGGPGHTIEEVKNTPGFAPYTGNTIYDGYVPPTGLFNEDYWHVHKDDIDSQGKLKYNQDLKCYKHEGIDFAAPKGTPIRSLIHGKIMIMGTHTGKPSADGMGDFMIVKSMNDPCLYYILVHLDRGSWKNYQLVAGNEVFPGQSVANVGHADADESAKKDNYHLHVSVVKGNTQWSYNDFPNGPNIINPILNTNMYFPIWSDIRINEFLNPFDYRNIWDGRK